MSLHTMTDAFAHSSWGYGKNVEKWQWGMPGDVTDKDKANDNKNIIPLRYEAARQAVLNSMDNIHISSKGILLTIEPSTTLDFCSRAYKDKNSATKKGDDEWDYMKYINKIDGKPIAIEMEYFQKGFGIKNIWKYAKKCEENPNKYLKRIDKDRIASVSGMFGVVKYYSKVKGPVNVSLINGKNEQELFSTTASFSAGILNLALNKDLKEGEYFIIKGYPLNYSKIKIDSKTLFKVPEKADKETIINLMDVWDIAENVQNGRIEIELTWNGNVRYGEPRIEGIKDQKSKKFINELMAKMDTDKNPYTASEIIIVDNPNISFLYYVCFPTNTNALSYTMLDVATVQVCRGNSLIDTFKINWINKTDRWNSFYYHGDTKCIIPAGNLY